MKEQMTGEIDALRNELDVLKADNARLEKTLRNFAGQWIGEEIDREQVGDDPDYKAAYESIVIVARAALKAHEEASIKR